MWSFLFVLICCAVAGWMVYRFGLPSQMDSTKKTIFWVLLGVVVVSVISWILPIFIFLAALALIVLAVWVFVDPKMREAILGKLK